MREQIRILAFFLSENNYGKIVSGEERRFLEISSSLTALGTEIFTLEYKPSISEDWGYSSYHSIGLNRRFRHHNVLEAIRLIIHGLRACIKFNCDVIYVPLSLAWGPLSIIMSPYVVSLLCRRPLVIVLHHLSKRALYYNNRIMIKTITLLAHKQAKTCIAVSQATADSIKRNFKKSSVIITGNGVNLNRFKSIKDQAKLYDAAYFGRISKEKGIYTLLEAWKIVTTKTSSAKLILLGGIEKNIKHTLRDIVKKLELDQNVIFAGFVSDRQAVNMLSSSKIFVLPSTEEGFGLTVAEAMAIGLPCILSDLPALKENFRSAAVFVKPNDVEGLAQEISALLSDPEKRRKLEKIGKKIAQRFPWETVAEKELEVLKNVIKN